MPLDGHNLCTCCPGTCQQSLRGLTKGTSEYRDYHVPNHLRKPLRITSTRLHSSRMRTARALTVSPSMLCAGGCTWSGGSAWSQGRVYLVPGGMYLVPGGVPGPGRSLLRGCLLPGGCTWSGTPLLWTDTRL